MLVSVIVLGAAVVSFLWWRTPDRASVPHPPSAPPSATVSPSGRKSIAVLPFVNLSSDKENEYFSDGITEDLLTALSKISGLHVAARTGRLSEAVAELHDAQRLQGAGYAEIASALGCAYADAGNRTEATKVLTRLRERTRDEFVSAAFIATIHVGLGEVDEAFAALAQAEAQHSYWVGW